MRLLNALSITACAIMFSGLFYSFQAVNLTTNVLEASRMRGTLPDASLREISILKERVSRAEETIQSLKAANSVEEKHETFCMKWKVNMDYWWTHHPDWYVTMENNTHYCFSPIEDPEKASVMRTLYKIQFQESCSNLTTKAMWNSGFGADIQNVVSSLKYAYKTSNPIQMYSVKGHWHYAAKKDGSRPVCPKMDMFCYFLDIGGCDPNPEQVTKGVYLDGKPDLESDGFDRWIFEYTTRQQTWLRRQVYLFTQKQKMATPCTTIHVRRADVVLHGDQSRRYRPIDEYVNAASNDTKNILLLTDDHNAIGEATTKFPNYNWMYIDRPRHKGAEGGWENQIPSDDPKLEVIVILSIFKLASQCSEFIHTHSSFGRMIKGAMSLKNNNFRVVNLDETGRRYSKNHSLSVNVSQSYT